MAVIGYVEEADFQAWLDERGITIDTDTLLVRALDWVELQQYKGTRTYDAQALSWPRTGVYIDGVKQDKDTVPELVKQLQMRVALDIGQNTDPLSVRSQDVKSKSVDGAVSVTYMDGTATAAVSRQTSLILAKLSNSGYGNQFAVSRG